MLKVESTNPIRSFKGRGAAERGARLVVDILFIETAEGAGTIGLELIRRQ